MELPPKLWFQLQRLKNTLASLGRGSGRSHDSANRMCPNCRALISRSESVCPFCGVNVKAVARARPSSGTPGRILGVIPIPSTATAVIAVVDIALYGVEWYLTQSAGGGSSMGGISGRVMVRLGAKAPYILMGQWWRLVTAIFLHAGLLHIGLNLWVLVDLGPEVESLFGSAKFTVMYLVTGVMGFLLSFWWQPFGISIGASGALMGLIGILIGASFHHGSLGKDYRRMLWRWVIYILIFGLLPFFAIDNAAHIGGLATGLVLGYFVPQGEPATRAGENLWTTLAVISVLIIAGSFALMALQLGRPLQ
jgi:rhomboid protease GluP